MRIKYGEITLAVVMVLWGVPAPESANLASRAWAQPSDEPPEALPVHRRPRPEFDPLGLRLGSVLVHPTVTTELFFDSNLLATANDPEGASGLRFSPSVSVESDWSRHSLKLDIRADRYSYFDHSSFDYWNNWLDTEGRIDIRHDLYLNFSSSIGRKHNLPGSVDSPLGTIRPLPYNLFQGEVELVKDFNRLRMSLGGSAERWDYKDVESDGRTINQDFRDNNLFETGGRLAYMVLPGYYAFGDIRVNRRAYDSPGASASDSQGVTVLAGLEFDLTSLIHGEVGLGYLTEDFDDPDFEDIGGFSYKVNLIWSPTTLMTLTLDGESQVNDSPTIGLEGGRIDSKLGAVLDYELLRNLIISPYGEFRREDYNQIDRLDLVCQFGLNVDYLVNRYVEVGAGYDFTHRNSDFPAASFDRHLVRLNVTAHF